MAGTTSTTQGSRPVHGAISVFTPNGDSAMDETNDAIRVNVVAGAGSGGTASTDDAAFSVGSGSGTPIMGLADETGPDSVDEGDVGVVRMTLPRALHVNLRDSSGNEITSFGGGTEYAEDTVSTAGDKVTMAGVVRKDTAATLVDTDGDRTQMQVDATGRLYVNASGVAVPVTDNAGSLTVDNPTLSVVGNGTAATSLRVTVASDSTGVIAVTDNAGSLTVDGTVSITANSSVNVNQIAGTGVAVNSGNLSAGVQRVTLATDQVQLTNALKVDGSAVTQPVSGTVAVSSVTTSIVPGTSATHLGKAEDAAHASGDTGVMALGVRNDAQATLAGTDADYSPMAVDAAGNSMSVGNIAHDGVDAGNPVKIGHKAIAHGTNPTAVAANDRTDWYANRHGIPFMLGGHPNIICREVLITAANGAQTDASIAGTINSGTKVVVTKCSAFIDADTTVNVAVRVGFGASTLGTASSSGVNGIILSHPDLAPGSGVVEGSGSGIIGIGGDGEEVRLTCDAPTSGNITVLLTYFTVES